MKNLKWISGMLLIASILIGCGESRDTSAKRQRQEEQAITDDYLNALEVKYPDLELEPDTMGIYYIKHEEGEGDLIKPGDKVHVYYYAMMCDTVEFDGNIRSNYTVGEVPDFETGTFDPYEFVVQTNTGKVVGWDFPIQNMKQGGVAQWIIPESLGYGSNPSNVYVRSYATLVYFVKVDKVYPAATDE